ncbi:hypothetical protein ACLKMH_18625 [Psychromonas sp. KJ10-10]|uniref:hypothetical protein n=1 Tax=Psychromonas sp. KJ10-10 TaxID=3391823 RepID=UPI0039B41EE7
MSLNKSKTYALHMATKPLNTTFKVANKNIPIINKMPFSANKHKVSNYKPIRQDAHLPSKFPARDTTPLVEKPSDIIGTARDLANTGHFKEALLLTSPIIDRSKQVELYLLHGEILLALKRFSDAMLTFKKALYLQSKNKEALHHLALLSQRLGDDENARRYFIRLNSNLEA